MRLGFLFVVVFGLAMVSASILHGNTDAALQPGTGGQRVTNTWTGLQSEDWFNGSNWNQNHVPTSSEDVVIPWVASNRYPGIAGPATCYSLTLNDHWRVALAIASGTLNVATNMTSYANLTMTSSSAALNVQGSLTFGSNANVTMNANATISVRGSVTFASGSNVSFANGTLRLFGDSHSYLYVYQAATLNNLLSDNSNDYTTRLHSTSTAGLTVNGSITVNPNSPLYLDYAGTTVLKGDLNVPTGAAVYCSTGTLSLQGNNLSALAVEDAANYLNHLEIAKGSGWKVELHNHLTVRGNLSIVSGIFTVGWEYSPGYYYGFYNITLGGNWSNSAGIAALYEGVGSNATVTLNGTADQTLSTENFNKLALNKSSGWMVIPSGSTVYCTSYDYVYGSYKVTGGTFTANDLADNGIYGTILITSGTINYTQDTVAGSYVDLNGSLNIEGGTVNVSGGNGNSVFGRGASAWLTLEGGCVLDFKNVGVTLSSSYTFSYTISASGTIRTVGSFLIQRNNFNPAGGTVELYGSSDASLSSVSGSNLRSLKINKAGTYSVTLSGPVSVLETLTGQSGRMVIPAGASLTCGTYDWVAGGYTVSGGSFIANDLADSGIYGSITLTSGTITYYQDTNSGSSIDLRGALTIRGGTFNVYGGAGDAYFYEATGVFLDMNAGTLDFKDRGIIVYTPVSFGPLITGGTIRTTGQVQAATGGFNPAGGLVEMYGGANSALSISYGSNLCNLTISKNSGVAVTATGNLLINGIFRLQSGTFNAPETMTVGGNWQKLSGTVFNPGTNGTVIFNGSEFQIVGGVNTFRNVTDNNAQSLFLDSTNSITGTLTVNLNVVAMGACTIGSVAVADSTAGLTFANQHTSVISSYIGWGTLCSLGTGTYVIVSDLIQNGLYGAFIADGGRLELHQDSASNCDINCNITIQNNGIIDIYGANASPHISYGGNVYFSMDSGEFNVRDQGLRISSTAYSCGFNVSGGIIRCNGTWYDERGIFQPTGGTVELTGAQDCGIVGNINSWFRNLTINKTPAPGGNVNISGCVIYGNLHIVSANVVTLFTPTYCMQEGLVNIQSGNLNLGHQSLFTTGNVIVDGALTIDFGANLYMTNGKTLLVDGGTLVVSGTSSNPAKITHNGTGYYGLTVGTGGTISASNAIFEYMSGSGLAVTSDGIVSGANPFYQCTFRNGAPGGTLLTVTNSQNLNITGASFGDNPTGSTYNVAKLNLSGSLTFVTYSGAFSGSAFEHDPYNRINWSGEILPVIDDLTISYIPASSLVRLDWSYPEPVTYFQVWRSESPSGTFNPIAQTSDCGWSQPIPGNHYFYRVTAYRQ